MQSAGEVNPVSAEAKDLFADPSRTARLWRQERSQFR